jgi:protein-tyrosine phosphatase
VDSAEQTVLFVCTGNYYRSRYAEYRFNALRPAHFGWKADSRGFQPSTLNPGAVSREAARRLREAGHAPEAFREPLRLAESDLTQAALVVILDEDEHRPYMQATFPNWEQQVRYWRVADLWGLTTDQALSLIDHEIDILIQELAARS